MKVNDKNYRSIWYDKDTKEVKIIDQRCLPYQFKIITIETIEDFEVAIKDMAVRGAPLIGATAAYGVALQVQRDPSDESIEQCCERLNSTRPTAINLRWALDRCKKILIENPVSERRFISMQLAAEICDEDVEINRKIGLNGLK